MQTLYTQLKVNNEYELCEIYDPDCKAAVERELLRCRISYFIKWPKVSVFSRKKYVCIVCVNESAIDEAEAVITELCANSGYEVKFLIKKSTAGDELF